MLEQESKAYVNAMKCEHRELGEMVHRLDLALGHAVAANWPRAAADDVISRLERLDHCLTGHFAREEEGGFLEEATAAAPRIGREAQGLLEEHAQLLARVRTLVTLGQGNCRALATSWQSFAEGLSATLKRLLAHEKRENELLQRAFNVSSDV